MKKEREGERERREREKRQREETERMTQIGTQIDRTCYSNITLNLVREP